jgi:putative membrane protein
MKVKNRLLPNSEVFFLAILGIFFFVGFIGHLLPLTRPLMLFLTPYLLLLCGLIALGVSLKEQGRTILLWAIPTFLITFALEAIGVATGLIFGSYQYGPVLGSHLWGVPPIIGFNWVLVVLGIARFVRKQLHVRHPALGALLASLLCVLFDVILEPLAIRLNYWTWEAVQVPFRNYAAWFLISYIFALPTWLFKREETSIFLQGYIAIQGLFFILVRLGLAFMP